MNPQQQRNLARVHHDDDAFDERGILRDGRSFRVTNMCALDSLGRAVSLDYSGAGNRPGFRFADLGLSAKRAKQGVYQQYDAEVSRAYLTPTGAGERGQPRGAREGDACMTGGHDRGHLQTVGGQQRYVPDKVADATTITDERAAAYAEYREYLRTAWRGHP
jgi:hypothetical protein